MDLEQLKKIAGITSEHKTSRQSFISEDMKDILKIAGIQPLVEAYDDDDYDDDEDEDVRVAEKEAKKRKIKLPSVKVNAEDDLEHIKSKKEKPVEKKEEPKEDPKKENLKPAKKNFWDIHDTKKEDPKKEKPVEKKDDSKKEPPVEKKEETVAKRRGKAPNPESKSGKLRQWIIDHPDAKRAEAWKHAVEAFGEKSEDNPGGITKAGFSTLYQNARAKHGLVKKKEVKEAWVIMHPLINNHILHENREMNQLQWVHFLSDNQDPMIFESSAEAEEVARYLRDFKNQAVVIERVELDN